MKQYSLSELCYKITEALGMQLSAEYWVRAEIAEMSVRQHAYFELVEKAESTGQLAAKVRATCWANTYRMLSAYFMQETGQQLRVGMQVLLQVEVSFHSVYGLSLNIIGIDPTYTLGDMARQRQLTIERLQKEGVFDMQQMLSLPTIIRRVAVISSSKAAGYQDFCHQLANNNYGIKVETMLFEATMQGDSAERSCVEALEAIFAEEKDYDVVAIIRGGGATTDLSCFDGYMLASACAQFPVPVITGIGHTRDTSVTDMVAFVSLKTPTAVAEYIIEHNYKQWQRIEAYKVRLQNLAVQYVNRYSSRLKQLQVAIPLRMHQRIEAERQRLRLFDKTIDLSSPETIYRKGYSLTTVNGKILRRMEQVKVGDEILTELIDGKVNSVVVDS